MRAREADKTRLPLAKARANAFKLDWSAYQPTRPTFLGARVFEAHDLAELAPYIDWTPFFQTWELKGRYPAILDDEKQGEAARALFDDAQAMLKQIVAEKLVRAEGGGRLLAGERATATTSSSTPTRAAGRRLATFFTLRQQLAKRDGRPNLALADFVAPRDATTSAASSSPRASRRTRSPSASPAPTTTIPRSSSRRSPTASPRRFAEAMHERVRRELWGYAPDETLPPEELIEESYRGIRPAPGYPAQPDHTEKATLFALLDAEGAHRRRADRELCDVAGLVGLRPLFRAPGRALFRRRQGRARPGRGLRRAQGHGGRARSSAGWRRS